MESFLFNVPAFDETYQILGEINAGGGGIIYKAIHKRLQKLVIVKQVKSIIRDKINVRGEADILKNLHHNYLPQVYDYFEVEDDCFTVLEFVEGSSFDQLLKAGQRFTQGQVIKWASQLCEVVQYLHSEKVLHSDIKPANIMLTPAGNICLIDFNISTPFDTDANPVGKSDGYAPPEQYTRSSTAPVSTDTSNSQLASAHYYKNIAAKIDPRSDIYSIGATLYHLISGVRPKTASRPQVPPEQAAPICGEALLFIIEKAMAPEPDKRFQTVEALQKVFRNIHKLDRLYHKKTVQQIAVVVITSVLTAIFAVLTIAGSRQLRQEDQTRYDDAIGQARVALDQGDYTGAMQLALGAQAIDKKQPEAYYINALALYQSGEIKQCAAYLLENETLDFVDDTPEEKKCIADLRFLFGNAYLDLEHFDEAIESLAQAIELSQDNAEYYRDYAIALAKTGQTSEAKTQLAHAERLGLSGSSLDLIKGEIEREEGNNAIALQYFQSAVRSSDDIQTKLRAALFAADLLEYDMNQLDGAASILEEARKQTDLKENLPLLERLGKIYTKLAGETEKDDYYLKAIDCYQTIIAKGRGTQVMYYNVSVMYRAIGQRNDAKQWLLKLDEKFSGNYDTFVQLAMIEIEDQEFKPNAQRDYNAAYQHYQKAESLFSTSNVAPSEDFQTLRSLVQELKSYGWVG